MHVSAYKHNRNHMPEATGVVTQYSSSTVAKGIVKYSTVGQKTVPMFHHF